MNQDTVNALKEVDRFHKNCALLFEDLVKCINEKLLTDTFEPLPSGQAGYYWVDANGNSSGYKRALIFEKKDTKRFQFVQMLVKTHEPDLRGAESPGFKAVCKRLDVDPLFPLFLVTGVFEPRDVSVSRFRNNIDIRRHWADHTLLLHVPQHMRLLAPDCYRFDEWLTIESEPGTDSRYCEKAAFKIRRLLDIHDSRDVEKVVNDLFSI